jgi:hypothetical protein
MPSFWNDEVSMLARYTLADQTATDQAASTLLPIFFDKKGTKILNPIFSHFLSNKTPAKWKIMNFYII